MAKNQNSNAPKVQLPKNCTNEMIEAWKQQGKRPFLVLVNRPGEETKYAAVCSQPSRDILSLTINQVSAGNVMEGKLFAYNNCILSADEEIASDDVLMIGASVIFYQNIEWAESEAVKL